MELAGKVVWITGASSGIGEALARACAARGAEIILSGRRSDALEAVAATLPTASLVLDFEATDYPALPDVVARAQGWRGRIDWLVNNAGISQRSLGLETSFEVYRRLMEIDFFAPLRLTQLVLPSMVALKSGRLLMMASLAGKLGSPWRTGYCAAKHALVGYSDALRAEIADTGVEVNVITPGFVRTGIATHALMADGSERGHSDSNIEGGITADEAAEQILAGIEAGQREILVGRGMEMELPRLKASNPDQLFDLMAQMAKAQPN